METFSTSLKIVPKALAIKKFSSAMKTASQRRSQVPKLLPKDVLPLVTSNQPPVSVVPRKGLVSGIPPITIPRYWGVPPSKKWGETGLPIARRIRALRPTEVGFFAALLNVVGAPVSVPAHIVGGMINLADRFRGQAEEERFMSPEDKIKDELLDLKMRDELDEMTEDEYRRQERDLDRRLTDVRESCEKEATGEGPERKRGITEKKSTKKGPKKQETKKKT